MQIRITHDMVYFPSHTEYRIYNLFFVVQIDLIDSKTHIFDICTIFNSCANTVMTQTAQQQENIANSKSNKS